MDKLLYQWGKIKKEMRGNNCYAQWKHFYLFFILVYEVMGKEDQVVLTTLSLIMATKKDEPILHGKGWVTVRIAITSARSYSRVLHGFRVTSTLQTCERYWALRFRLILAQ